MHRHQRKDEKLISMGAKENYILHPFGFSKRSSCILPIAVILA